MKTRRVAFELEATLPGTFLLQGFAGGAFAGFIFMFLLSLLTQPRHFIEVLIATPFLMVVCGALGGVKSVIIYGLKRVTGISMSVVTRIFGSIIGITLFISLFGLLLGIRTIHELMIGVGFAVAMGLPTALLVGSRVRPWRLFTFGTFAVYRNGIESRVGSNEFLPTVATLPLRFLSAAILASWILYFAYAWSKTDGGIADVSFYFLVPLLYLSWSTYLSFRSPRKVVLLVSGLALNVPLALLGYFTITGFPASHWWDAMPRIPIGLSFAFVLSWLVFLAARMSATTESFPKMTLNDILNICKSDGADACLGARFFDWQKHVS